MRQQKATGLNYQRDASQTCKKHCKGKVHGAQERLVWEYCKTAITEHLKNTLDEHLSRIMAVLLTLPSMSYGLFPGYFIRFLYSTSFPYANTHILI